MGIDFLKIEKKRGNLNKLSHNFARASEKYFRGFLLRHLDKKNILEIGCGSGSSFFFLRKHISSFILEIDISESEIIIAKKSAEELNLKNLKFAVMPADDLQLKDNTFDLVCGNAILHHINIKNTMEEIKRVLKPKGAAVFREPLGYNPLVNLFRIATPFLREKNEHPLKKRDLEEIKLFFDRSELKFFFLTSLLLAPFSQLKIIRALVDILDRLDIKLFQWFPFLRYFAWGVVISLEGPKK